MKPRRGAAPRAGDASGSGFALPAVLLALLVLTAVFQGTLLLGRYQGLVARGEARALQARVAAESAVLLAASTVTVESLAASAASGATLRIPMTLAPDVQAETTIHRLASEWLWVESRSAAGGEPLRGTQRVGAVYWSLEPLARLASLSAVLELGGPASLSSPSSVRPFSPSDGPDPGFSAGVCDPESVSPSDEPVLGVAVDSLSGAGSDLSTSSGEAPESALARIPPLGRLDGPALLLRASESAAGATSGLLVVEGDFVVPEEGLMGVVAVSGDLIVGAGTELAGLVLVGGSLRLLDGARLVGAARVAGAAEVEGSGTILGSPCAVIAALGSSPELRRPLSLPDGTWVRLP